MRKAEDSREAENTAIFQFRNPQSAFRISLVWPGEFQGFD